MGQPYRTVRHDPVTKAIFGLAQGLTFSPDVDDIRPLGLMTFGFVVSDTFVTYPTPTTSYSACPTVVTGYSLIAAPTTNWSLA